MAMQLQPQRWSGDAVRALKLEIGQQIRQAIPINDAVLKEAMARGLDFNTEAALKAALKSETEISERVFDLPAFVDRVADLTDEDVADQVEVLLAGVNFDLLVEKRSEPRQASARHSDIAYDVSMATTGGSASDNLPARLAFALPDFGQVGQAEPYRVDSAHDRRGTADDAATNGEASVGARVGILENGRWRGGFYIYAPEHQQDDARSVGALRFALARAVLRELASLVPCAIVRPEGYAYGAWRAEMQLPRRLLRLWKGSALPFELPQLPARHFVSTPRYGLREGRFVEGRWEADLYSNGTAEDQNPTSLAEVQHALEQSVREVVGHSAALFNAQPFVFDEAGRSVGTVQLRAGRYEAWKRVPSMRGSGRAHSFVGKFLTREAAQAAVRRLL